MRESVFYDGPHARQRVTRFWILLVLSAIISAAGVVADSTATVIGAMIVAPMLGPIQGTMLGTVLGDRKNLVRSATLMVLGVLGAVAIGYLVGAMIITDVNAATNSQVAARVAPGLIDLLAALATGVVGSIALVRKDISDTLPGVAIAISLVPPLSVAGLTLESGEFDEAFGALLLFLTNVAAILATGIVVMALYRVQRWPSLRNARTSDQARRQRRTYAFIAVMLIIIAVPLAYTSWTTATKTTFESTVRDAALEWAEKTRWELISVETRANGNVLVRVTGVPPVPDHDSLGAQLEDAGIDSSRVDADFVPSTLVNLGTDPDGD